MQCQVFSYMHLFHAFGFIFHSFKARMGIVPSLSLTLGPVHTTDFCSVNCCLTKISQKTFNFDFKNNSQQQML